MISYKLHNYFRARSHLENQVKRSLEELRLMYEQEKQIGLYFVDFFIAPSTCIEVNGPNHYIGSSASLNNSTKIKARVLEKLGYRVVQVPMDEWNAQGGPDRQTSYLKDKLGK